MSDLISKRAVLAKINLWANGELSTDKLIESIKKMSGGSSSMGHWVEDGLEYTRCPKCKSVSVNYLGDVGLDNCPNCGAELIRSWILTGRPCNVCRFKTENGCNRFECVFKGV